ncbi:MAG: phosphoribosylglycinamide formyltransferase [Polyangiales bacterium]
MRLGVLVSGSGTNLQALLDAEAAGSLSGSVVVVISNKPGVAALDRAARHGVPSAVISHREHATREDFDRALVAALRDHGVELVVLAGFMRIVTRVFLDAFPQRVVNVHPSLLPAFPGVDAQAQALAYGAKVTGCTVHLVDAGVDTGPILAQTPVAVLDDDTVDTLKARILREEHRTLVAAVNAVATGRARLDGRRVTLAP